MSTKVNHIGWKSSTIKAQDHVVRGCGHNAISERIIECFYDARRRALDRGQILGIGCSSKSPAYFLALARLQQRTRPHAAIATGAILANRNLLGLGVTGDGDTASIGLGQFMHLVRQHADDLRHRGQRVYGLTKGQFSATADLGSTLKTGIHNDLPPFDCCALAMRWGATSWHVLSAATRSNCKPFSKRHCAPRLSVVDVISPCVTFNDHEGSTRATAM